ncbi:translation initiation factor IF-2 [Candidatus Woesearchaeota archaeon]|jgi:translation initiation factor 5B|nr:translation initiation factor IF-2 [Candidatus Woesearchaeota archaeon]MBT3304830.1 translation initiation factor IF-2 [Candidatus Woesearchaeota archaeon]MBT4367834.1 translation initiation factor IF-2 [Candidatus Woesearchaeota archaeon]MBT4712322.1 translation initiation factor IF-2 [Candidatus Woesearchaeota archaeon]MBT6639234.1 translation initiation factor IF-2 [Candidatus Woesearchaeota archaeon]
MLRKPIVTVVGHVDHGKTTLLDSIRQTTVTEGEAGKITQAIGASIIPVETIQRVCGNLMKEELKLPGLLFIDTPGHAAFSTLRKRGGSLADIAIVVVDLNEGFMPQTEEAIDILKKSKTPFLIAANKMDLIQGWEKKEGTILTEINSQHPKVQQQLETKMYELVGKLHEKFELNADRFDRVQDYTSQIAIVPISAFTQEGLPEVLMVLIGLVQKYLEKCLECDVTGNAKGTILEVKEQKGVGKVLDVIIYDGSLRPGDPITIAGLNGPISTKIRGLFEPAPHSEMMEKKAKYKSVKEVLAATGVRILAPNVDDVIAGMPIVSCRDSEAKVCEVDVQEQLNEVLITSDSEGIIIKADTLGSLEALISLVKDKEIPIRKATLGEINKKDLADAESSYEKDKLKSVILAFNVEGEESTDKVKVIRSNVIYKVIEEYELWTAEMRKDEEEKELGELIKPCKIEIMKGYVFRQSNPAICGVSVEEGEIKTQMPLMNKQGKDITVVKALQEEQENISVAIKGKQVACSMGGVTVGRQVNEGDTLYSSIPEEDFRKLKELKHLLAKEELAVLKEIALIKREINPMWGV